MISQSRLPADQDVRAAVLAPERNFLVEAPAGSGKTGLLTARFLRLLATVDKPEQVLAITFTKAAVAEMRDRVLSALESARRNKMPDTPQQEELQQLARSVLARAELLDWRLLEPARLNIKTIDSLALQIASQLPLLSRLGPALEPDDDATWLYRSAATRAMRVLEKKSSAPRSGGSLFPDEQLEAEAAWNLLRHRDNNLPQCIGQLADMLAQRDLWTRHFSLDETELSDAVLDTTLRPMLEQQLRNINEQALVETTEMWRRLDSNLISELVLLANHAGTHDDARAPIPGLRLDALPGTAAENLVQWHALAELLLTQEPAWRKGFNINQGFPPGDALKPAAIAFVEELAKHDGLAKRLHDLRSQPPDHYTDEQWSLIKSLFRLLRLANRELHKIFAETGRTDFVEVSLAALKALRHEIGDGQHQPTDLALVMGESLQHILVDEFQDTSRTQLDLLELLVSGWTADGARTLFFVGDPMQSIYSFRQAEVRLFAKTRDQGLGNLRLEERKLTVNFRCQQSLVEAHNQLFPVVFKPQSEVKFTESVSFIAAEPRKPLHWHFNRKPSIGSDPEAFTAASQREASQICDEIEQYSKDPSCKIALLVRIKRHADFVLAELRRRKILYRAVDLEKLCDRQEVLDIASLTRALLHPADRIAWLSVLRAPWCGLTLAGMEALCGLDLQKQTALPCIPDLLSARAASLPGDDAVIAARVCDVLIPALSRRTQTRLPQLVYETWRALGGHECLDDEQFANVQAFFRLLDGLDQQGVAVDAASLDSAMARFYAPADPLAGDQIQVMSIHKAKGLTFDVVIVPGMDKIGMNDSENLLNWIELEDGPRTNLVISPISSSGADKSPLATLIRRVRKDRTDAELRRMFYVAATRARKYVHFFAAVEKKDSLLIDPRSTSLLGVAWDAVESLAEQQFAAMPDEAFAMAAHDSTERAHLVRRLPSDWNSGPDSALDVSAETVTAELLVDDDTLESRDVAHSLAAGITGRAVGTLVHSLLEQVATLFAAGETDAAAGAWLASRERSVPSMLRMLGVPEPSLHQAGHTALGLVQKALNSPTGRWILAAHPGGENELRVSLSLEDRGIEQRIDRVFLAGSEPLASGASHLWIVDYKTAAHSAQGLDEFLQQRRLVYGPTLLAYANAVRALRKDRLPVLCALYYVALDHLEIVARLDP